MYSQHFIYSPNLKNTFELQDTRVPFPAFGWENLDDITKLFSQSLIWVCNRKTQVSQPMCCQLLGGLSMFPSCQERQCSLLWFLVLSCPGATRHHCFELSSSLKISTPRKQWSYTKKIREENLKIVFKEINIHERDSSSTTSELDIDFSCQLKISPNMN